MREFTVVHDIDCSADHFWELMTSTDFSRELFAYLDVPTWEAEQKDEGDIIVRHVKGQPKMAMPGPLARVLGPSFAYKEIMRFDKKNKKISFTVTTGFSSKLRNEGVIRGERRDGGGRLIVDFVHEAAIFGIGGILEKNMEKMSRQSWEKAAVFINRYVKENPPKA